MMISVGSKMLQAVGKFDSTAEKKEKFNAMSKAMATKLAFKNLKT